MLAKDDAQNAHQERQMIIMRSDTEKRAGAEVADGPDRGRLVKRMERAEAAEPARARTFEIGRDARTPR